MFENISILVQSVKGLGKCAHFPTVARMLFVVEGFAAYMFVRGSAFYLKSPLINCLRLWFFRRVERTSLSTAYCLTPTVFEPWVIYILEHYYKESDKDFIIYFVRFNSPELRMGV